MRRSLFSRDGSFKDFATADPHLQTQEPARPGDVKSAWHLWTGPSNSYFIRKELLLSKFGIANLNFFSMNDLLKEDVNEELFTKKSGLRKGTAETLSKLLKRLTGYVFLGKQVNMNKKVLSNAEKVEDVDLRILIQLPTLDDAQMRGALFISMTSFITEDHPISVRSEVFNVLSAVLSRMWEDSENLAARGRRNAIGDWSLGYIWCTWKEVRLRGKNELLTPDHVGQQVLAKTHGWMAFDGRTCLYPVGSGISA
ncbi:hypothetical protein R1flu_010738 [Riccia fluitans]|uniref:Uncharacterized protein n=1 Tax=Riccia fluitans TaxID=41844 RepID=A0ABD1Z5T8_9MARC